MEISIKNDYTIHEELKEELKYIREIQLDVLPQFRFVLDNLMSVLGVIYKIYQYNTTDRKEYDYFSWTCEGGTTITLTYNYHEPIRDNIYSMERLFKELKNINEPRIKVWVKMNDIRTLIKEDERGLI